MNLRIDYESEYKHKYKNLFPGVLKILTEHNIPNVHIKAMNEFKEPYDQELYLRVVLAIENAYNSVGQAEREK